MPKKPEGRKGTEEGPRRDDVVTAAAAAAPAPRVVQKRMICGFGKGLAGGFW